ncbi:MAG: CDP-diacylglycerol--glycerol-3-phosphate 3-phosphatidyltransferase [Erysipelotrichaceae bacterium]|jgi:CDP-diacylglycerol--glycerol-3-phosphate 3-phosphatidyltransferase|nr:CDP-diacylglycerol--glycerol-3-phosphate 3-phosphatidyltransferase [Erysipelotrichaceae bacterium]
MNLPNKLSLFRIALVPIILLIYIFPYAQCGIAIPEFTIQFVTLRLTNILILILFVAACVTDYLDGYIARRDHLVTSFGKFIDPIADKLLVNTMLIVFAVKGIAPVVPVILMIWRDVIVDGLRMNASSKGIVVAAGYLGKIKTVLQMATIVLILLNNLPFELWRLPLSEIMLWFAAFVSIISGVSYFMQLKDIIMETM